MGRQPFQIFIYQISDVELDPELVAIKEQSDLSPHWALIEPCEIWMKNLDK